MAITLHDSQSNRKVLGSKVLPGIDEKGKGGRQYPLQLIFILKYFLTNVGPFHFYLNVRGYEVMCGNLLFLG